MSTTPKTYYLIDGSGYIFRAFHALPMMTRKSDGLPVNAVYGFTNMLIRLLADLDADHIAVIYDASERSFRKDIYPAYKAQRPDPPEELIPQFPLIRATSEAFSLPGVEIEGFEADDIIATYARMAREEGSRVVIVSSDKDMMQLVGDGVTMLDPIKNKPIDAAEVMEKFGVMPDRVVDVQSLAGDSVDNVPGVPGIGIKTAAQLITEYGDLDSLLARAGEIKQPKRRESLIEFAEQARISRELVKLRTDAPVPFGLDGIVAPPPNRQKLVGFLEEMGFRSTITRVEASFDKLGDTGAGGEPAAPDQPAAVAQDYQLVQDTAALQRWADAAIDAGVLAIDTETNSLDAEAATLVGISLATAPGRACYIPVAHVPPEGDGLNFGGEMLQQIPLAEIRRILGPVLVDPSVLKVGHNLKYDAHVLGRPDVSLPITTWDDTMLISYVLDGGAHGHGMDELSELHLQHRTIPYSSVCGTGKSAITFDRVPLDRALAYAAEDADITLRLYLLLKPRLVAERMATVYETIERPLVGVISNMEMEGIKVDRAALARLSLDFAERMAALEAEIHALAGGPFNVGSPKQLGEVLFERLGIPGGKKSSKTGAYSTDSSVLEQIAAQHGAEIATKILEWRQLAKLKGTYTDALQGQINEKTGRVHTSFSLAATNTGRLSSNEPNLQNIPIRTEEGRKIRYAFVAEEGHKLISVDYSQIELRLVAQIANVSLLKQAFQDGTDIHAMTASQVFGVPLAEMTPDIRRKAKAINFGIIYGISGFGLAAQLGIPQGEATAFIRAYLDRLPELKAWMDETKRIARERGWVETVFGRKCHVPGIKDPNPARRAFAERQAINAPIQGTAADIIKRAMGRLPHALAEAGLKARMLLQVHDELLFEAPEDEAQRTAEVAQAVMQSAATLEVPLIAEAGIGRSWAEAH